MEHFVYPKRWYLPTSPHNFTTQKTNIEMFTAVRASNPIYKTQFRTFERVHDCFLFVGSYLAGIVHIT
jgi:hypothetical protein